MKKFLCVASVIGAFLFGSAVYADLDTALLIDATGDSIGQVTGDITGQDPVTLWELPGGDGDLWNNGDTFTFLHDSERQAGDFTATVRVAGQTAAVDGRWGKGGIMVRHNLEPDASNAAPVIYTGNGSQIDPPTADSFVTDHNPVDVRVNGRPINGDNGNGFENPIFRDGAPFLNNFAPPAAPGDTEAPVNPAWLRVQYDASEGVILGAYADDINGVPGEFAYSDPITNVDIPEEGWYVGLAYSAHGSLVPDDLEGTPGPNGGDNPDGLHGLIFDNFSFVNEFLLPDVQVGGSEIGSLGFTGALSDTTFGPDIVQPGLTNYFYDRNLRPGSVALEAEGGFIETAGLDGSDFDEGEFGPVHNPLGLWAGSNGPLTIGDTTLPSYPAGTFSDANRNNYSAIARGEIFIPADGEYTFVDGIDDFTLLAIDLDGDGELGGLDDVLSNADVGEGAFDEVAIIDDAWANVDGGGGNGGGNNVSIVEFENISGDGEWRQIELWVAEGGGGDAGVLYFGNTDDFDPDPTALPLTPEEQADFLLTSDQIRAVTNEITGGNSAAALDTGVNYVVQVDSTGADSFSVDDQGGVLTTTLDVSDATITIEDMDLAAGTEVQLFDADNITGTDTLTLNFADPSQWDLSRISEGIITFGEGGGDGCNPNTLGDIDGSGDVAFADFLILSQNFGQAAADHTTGDIDCSGDVAFADFLVLSQNFGQTVGGAQSVPEPTGLFLLGLAGLMGGALRRRRS